MTLEQRDRPTPGAVVSGEQRLSPTEVASLHALFSAELLLFLTGVLRSHDLAQEALQNTFQRVLEAGHNSRAETRKGWLFKVGFHEAMALKRRQHQELKSAEKLAIQKRLESSGIGGAIAEHGLISTEELQGLRRALEQLPTEQREVVERRIYQEQTFAEIAADQQLPLGTVLTRMRLATEKLTRWLKPFRTE